MDSFEHLLTGFLGGSVVTIFFQELFATFSRRAEHKRDLRKMMYARKLEMGEKIISFNIRLLQRLNTAIALLTQMSESLKGYNMEALNKFQEFFRGAVGDLKEFEKVDVDAGSAAFLYYDFDHQGVWGEEFATKGYAAIVKVHMIITALSEISNKLQEVKKGNDVQLREKYENDLRDGWQRFVKSFEDLLPMCNGIKTGCEEVINGVKSQLNK